MPDELEAIARLREIADPHLRGFTSVVRLADLRIALARLDAAEARVAALREALQALVDRNMPTHSAACAAQDDEAECFCGTAGAMKRAYALLVEPPEAGS